jgi:monoamine oxidase
MGRPVASVTQDDRSVTVRLRSGETLTGDRAICALPCPVIGRMFEGARLSEAEGARDSGAALFEVVKVFLQAKSRFWLKEKWSAFVTTDRAIEPLTPDPGVAPQGRGALAAYPMAGYAGALEAMSESERVAAGLAQTREIFPEMAREFEGGMSKAWGGPVSARVVCAAHAGTWSRRSGRRG